MDITDRYFPDEFFEGSGRLADIVAQVGWAGQMSTQVVRIRAESKLNLMFRISLKVCNINMPLGLLILANIFSNNTLLMNW
jgi:hypothetical protein